MSSAQPTDAEAYAELVRDHGERLWRLAYRLTGDRQEAEDVTQEAFYEAWKSLPSLREPSAVRSWLSAILRHRAYRRLRRAGVRTVPLVEGDAESTPLARPELERLAFRQDLQQALDALEPVRRLAFLMVFHEGYSCREVAEHLGIPLGTVLSRVHRARGELRHLLRAFAAERTDRARALRQEGDRP